MVTANCLDGETLIVASYNKDSMVDCKIYPNSTGSLEIQVSEELDTNGATKVKAFIWQNLESTMPVCDYAEEEL